MDKTSSAGDPGTLYQLKCKLNRKDVNEKVTKAFPGWESFFSTVLDGYVVYATMEYFEMAFQMTVPLKICQGEVQMVVLHSLRKLEKWSISLFSLRFSQKQSCWKMHYKRDQSDESQTCYRCRYPGCDKMYVHEERRNNHEINVHGMRIEDHQPDRSPPNPKDEDGIFNYSHNILKTGLLLRDLQDAIKEGDGGRMEYLWKFLMLMFKVCGKTKYALAAIRLHAQLIALLIPREAHSLRWNRTINRKGGVGRNVAIDQVMEHNVQETKDLMYAHDANLNFSSSQTYSRASNPVKDTINNSDHENKLRKESSKHKRRKDGDIYVVVSTLQEVDALNEITGRTHRGIGTIPKDPISALNFKDLNLG